MQLYLSAYKLRDSKFDKQLSKPRINSLKRAFVHHGAMTWNSMLCILPNHVMDLKTLICFCESMEYNTQLIDTTFFQRLLKEQSHFSA